MSKVVEDPLLFLEAERSPLEHLTETVAKSHKSVRIINRRTETYLRKASLKEREQKNLQMDSSGAGCGEVFGSCEYGNVPSVAVR